MRSTIDRWYKHPLLGYLLVVLIAALPLFGHLDDLPIQFYDEQRLATNALEMNASGNLIVTTFERVPDYSNTKPPLMIWLQAASMRLIGNNELAVRLPAAIAALATCLLLYGFCARRLQSSLLGILSVLVLCTAQGYISLHGTRTGDYDALLTLFTTGYCLYYLTYLEEGKLRYLYFTCIFLMLAIMTKSVAGCLMLPALLLYTLWQRKTLQVLRSGHFYIGALIVMIPVAGYYLYRQHLDPGYFAAVAKMDLGGRYLHELSPLYGPEYYVNLLVGSFFVPWFVVSIAGILAGAAWSNPLFRRITIYAALAAAVYIGVISYSVTKFHWYLLPAYPMMALLAGFALYRLYITATGAITSQKAFVRPAIAVLATTALFLWPYSETLERNLNPQTLPSLMENGMMAYFMKDVLHGRRNIDGQYVAIESYEANVRWYFRALAAKGQIVPTIGDRKFVPGQTVIAYQQDIKGYIEQHFSTKVIEDFRGVIVYKIIQAKS